MPGEPPARGAVFDQIAPQYDATRDPVAPEVADRLASLLRDGDGGVVLEVGVGTGRMAVPLGERGLTVAGVDRSWAMLGYARGKGLSRLMHGDAYHLPIRSASVAHVLYVHVLHLLSHPAAALREAHRVSRGEVVALFHRQRPIRTHPSASVRAPVREAFYRRLAHEGYPLDPRPSRPWRRERELLSRFPPTRLTTLSEGVRVETATERLRLVRRRALRKFIDVPAEVIEAAVDEILPQVDGWRTTFEDTVLCAQWRPAKGGTRHRAPRGGGN